MANIEQAAAIQAHRPPPRYRKRWRLPRPRTADGASMTLAVAMGLGVPLWFLISQWWNPTYDPGAPWVWNVPGTLAMTYLVAQIFFLLISAGRSDRIGMSDTAVSGLAFISVFGTAVVIIVRALEGHYNLGGFQSNLIFALLETTLAEFLFTGWMRFLVNRRYFATAPAAQPDEHHDQVQ